MGQLAARHLDPIAHTNALTRFLAKAAAGLIGGMVAAALAGAAVAAVVGTGGLALGPIAAGIAVVGARVGGGILGGMAGDALVNWLIPEQRTNCGSITSASTDVIINGRGGVRSTAAAPLDIAACGKDNPTVFLAQGSDSVFFDQANAVRKDDKTTCGAVVNDGAQNVIIGGGTATNREISEEVPAWVKWAIAIASLVMIARSLRCLPKLFKDVRANLPCLLELGAGLGMAAASFFGNPIHVATGGKVLNGRDDTDFVLPGYMPIEWRRFYNSHDHRDTGPLGPGWSLPYTVALELGLDGHGAPTVAYVDDQGRRTGFPALSPGESGYSVSEGLTLYRSEGGEYVVQTIDGLHRLFEEPVEGQPIQTLLLRRVEDRNGNYLSLRYDLARRLHEIADGTGRLLRCEYAGDARRLVALHLVTPAEGEMAGVLVRYRYDAAGCLAEVIDRGGVRGRSFVYADGLMVQHVSPGGLSCHYEWESPGHGTGPDGARRVLRHWTSDGDSFDLRYEVLPAGGGSTEIVDHLGRVLRWQWNADHQVTQRVDALGRIWRFDWNEQRLLLAETDPAGNTRRYGYDDNGLLLTETDELGRTRVTHWVSTLALPAQEIDADDARWNYQYDDFGNLITETDPAESATTYAYDPHGLPILITDARGGAKRLTWTPRAQLASYTDCSGKTTRYHYDLYGSLARITDALGQETVLQHDALGLLITANLPDNAHLTWQYDAGGRLIAEIDALARQTRYAVDVRGRVVNRADAAGRLIMLGYDRAQRLARLTPENGQPYDFSYDDADRLTEEKRPDGTRLGYEYDAAGRVIAVTHYPGIGDDIFTEIETRGADRQAPSPQGPRRTELIRDAAGQLIEKRCGLQVSRFRYDPAGRLIEAIRLEKASDDAQPQARHSVRFAYDSLGRVVTETSIDHVRGETQTLRHEHDALGNRTRSDLPDLPGRNARSLHYLHYGSGHLHQVRLGLGQSEDGTPTAWQVVADFERDDLHREILRSQGKLSTRFMLDPLGRRLGSWTKPQGGYGLLPDSTAGFQAAQTQGASLIEGLTKAYRYDPTGELRESHHGFKGETRFEYDPTGRIESVLRHNRAGQAQAEHFAYDPAGNLLDTVSAQSSQNAGRGYVRDNRVHVFEDKRFAYDGFGRLIEKRSGRHTQQRFEWDEEDRLRSVTTTRHPGTEQETRQTVSFEYDALGRRVLGADAFGTTRFIWEGMRLIEEQRGSHATAYVYEPDSYVPMARIDTSAQADEQATEESSGAPAQVLYFHTDPSGLPEELSDERGRVRWRAAYKTWGNTVVEQWEALGLDGRPAEYANGEARLDNQALPIEQNLRFQGQYLDRDTGLHYNTFRYYDPDIGRFISPDPIGLAGGPNLYSYAPNPVSWVDPWGWTCGNSRSSTKAQHGYEVVDTATGSTVAKTGVSGGRVRLDGKSSRAEQQVRAWNSEPGNTNRYESRIVKTEPAGPGARGKILDWESPKRERQPRHTRPSTPQ